MRRVLDNEVPVQLPVVVAVWVVGVVGVKFSFRVRQGSFPQVADYRQPGMHYLKLDAFVF